MSIYNEIIQAGIETDHHESDLYVKACPTADAILANHGRSPGGVLPHAFVNRLDGSKWYDLPFQYEPFWQGKS